MIRISTIVLAVAKFTLAFPVMSIAAGADHSGQFEPSLVAQTEDHERVVFKLITRDRVKGQFAVPDDAHLTAARLMDPRSSKYSIIALLVEEPGEAPVMFVDTNGDDALTDNEKLELNQTKEENPFLWEATATLTMKDGLFTGLPIYIRFFKSVRYEKMGPQDRLITQSTEVMARGQVDVRGKKVLVQYSFDAPRKKVDPMNGLLGVDCDGDGIVDMGKMSPEGAKADSEAVVFRVGSVYLSTRRADVSKNQIVMREHEAKDYKRVEIFLNKEFPDFNFTDFDNKKRKFSEFRGKYVLLDIWGFWCPPCREELPYLREAHRRFQSRNLEVVGLNTDPHFTVESMRKALRENGMDWTHAQFSSVQSFISVNLRVTSFPTTFLIAPDGKVLSVGRSDRGEPNLRGRDLLTTLDDLLPAI